MGVATRFLKACRPLPNFVASPVHQTPDSTAREKILRSTIRCWMRQRLRKYDAPERSMRHSGSPLPTIKMKYRDVPMGFNARASLGWLLTAFYLLGGVAALAGAVQDWNASRAIAYLELPPDGREHRTPPLRSSARYDYRVVIDGTFRGRFNGAIYDAEEVWVPGEEPAPHNGLELLPAALIPAGPSGTPHRHVFVPAPESDLAGQPVVARLDPDRLTADMELPPGEQQRAFEGALRLVVWERPRSRPSPAAAGYAVLAMLLGVIGIWRLRRHRIGHPRRMATPKELEWRR
jgi:hypothetical protein